MASDQNRRLQRAIELAQNEQFEAARAILKELVLQNPRLPLAWMWLAAVSSDEQERINALQRVLALDPGNQRARTALEALGVVEGNIDSDTDPRSAPEQPNEQGLSTAIQQNNISPPLESGQWLSMTELAIVGVALLIAIFLIGSVVFYREVVNAPTETPTATQTFTPSATFTALPTNTPLPTRTPLPTQPSLPPPLTPTIDPGPPPTNTPRPSFTPRPTATAIRFFSEEDARVFGG